MSDQITTPAIDSFTNLCLDFDICVFQNEELNCVYDENLTSPHGFFSALLVLLLIFKSFKEVARALCVAYIAIFGVFPKHDCGLMTITTDFVSRSLLAPLLALNLHSRQCLDIEMVLGKYSARDCLNELIVEGLLGALPELGLSVW